MTDARESSDYLDFLSRQSDRNARETADWLDFLYTQSNRDARVTGDYFDFLYTAAPPAIETRCTQVGCTIFWLPAIPPTAPSFTGCTAFQGSAARFRTQGSAPGFLKIQGSVPGFKRIQPERC